MNPNSFGNLMDGLHSEWAVLLAILILSAVQLINIVITNSKSKREKIEKQRQIRTLDKIELYLKILSDKYTEEITERQLPIIIKEFLNSCKNSVVNNAYLVITKNDISNQEKVVRGKLTQQINNAFQSTQVSLSLFKWKGRLVLEFIYPNWVFEITEGVLEIVIYTTKLNKLEAYNQLESFVDQKFDFYINEALSIAYNI